MGEQQRRRWIRWRWITFGSLAVGMLLGGHPLSVLAAERIALLRLESTGQVIEINPATNVAHLDLDTYLRSRLRGKKISEVKLQECRDGGAALILIRYEE